MSFEDNNAGQGPSIFPHRFFTRNMSNDEFFELGYESIDPRLLSMNPDDMFQSSAGLSEVPTVGYKLIRHPDGCIYCPRSDCQVTFMGLPDVIKHLEEWHGASENVMKALLCPFDECKAVFMLRNYFDIHVRNAHNEDPAKYEAPFHPNRCDIDGCTKWFGTQNTFRGHLFQWHNDADTARGRFQCPFVDCTVTTLRKLYFDVHVRTVHGEDPAKYVVKCPSEDCSQFFTHQKFVQKHIINEHGSEKAEMTKMQSSIASCAQTSEDQGDLFKCNVEGCGKSFSKEWMLKRHTNVSHGTPDRLMCSQPNCRSTFTSPGRLARHVSAIHINIPDKRWKCPKVDCEASFGSLGGLWHHKRTHGDAKGPTGYTQSISTWSINAKQLILVRAPADSADPADT
ncbi:hypothetical protein BO70DRAFT_396385 [Aspergillus heteromorphus CBS 117.55]|uniref:C2H2-type domain-containing protein n=1 Tax=Aspergillus heteromorphus CBS 117.55 TaxID=1448321 RepID=A0A317W6T6_9EURO|nr:uncharacterized protein BO70DRAFT_396385 [Aspergillus heteromorphus CBS 117.55]PWY82093.1 hypothetical protein BO70DRAFT_396385 [Aspergillus heteromorphus CBS 117.55]